MSAAEYRKPWPMKWVVLAIVLFIVPYTFLTLHYRKPGPDYRPYEDIKDRANTIRLLSSGYQRITVGVLRPAEPVRSAATAVVMPAPGGLPANLADTLIDHPLLPVSIDRVLTPAESGSVQQYRIQFTCTLPDNSEQPAGGQLYLREGELVVVPLFEKLDGGLLARSRESTILLTVPAGAIKPGRYEVTLIGAQTSRRWTLQVH
jgi:hypothetical protein